MTILIVALAAWWVAGWKIGAALAVGACLEFIEAAVLWRGMVKLRRENAALAELARGLARDLENSVESYLESLNLEGD
ncbi:MAG: hypothetical protein ABSH56_30045 [Bryobacteraceae bacterium]